ncbi:chorismate synthase [Treponema lecithinolyticum]|uniref:chorismate synthase n=1 Tax=Treponema lecithinolyticum TaxID=53418 RepID=UPI0028E2220E|nr:chorismate synthase [Treponema lecithinolyticum]
MSGNTFGSIFRVTTFGESHGEAVGAVIDGCPAGLVFDIKKIQNALDKRKPGSENPATSTRKEPDRLQVISGVYDGVTTGAPITLTIKNTDANSDDYKMLKNVFRPSHADYTWQAKYGIRDWRGGGRASGRESAARVAAGAVAQMLLEKIGVTITAYTKSAAGIHCSVKSIPDKAIIEANPMKAADAQSSRLMMERIEKLGKKGESCGGIVECIITGVPAGWGEPVFEKLDSELAKAVLSIGGVKGIEFGLGFLCANLSASEYNDELFTDDGTTVRFKTNRSGGILGGISNGEPIVFRAAVKPVPSARIVQKTVRIRAASVFENTDIQIKGRHDVCLCARIVPVVEAMSALCLADMYMRNAHAHL